MKKNIHPKYENRIFKCVCGHVVTTRSTMDKDTSIEICSNCHPFFTGKQKLVDSAGRVERFRKKYGTADKSAKAEEPKKDEKKPAPSSADK